MGSSNILCMDQPDDDEPFSYADFDLTAIKPGACSSSASKFSKLFISQEDTEQTQQEEQQKKDPLEQGILSYRLQEYQKQTQALLTSIESRKKILFLSDSLTKKQQKIEDDIAAQQKSLETEADQQKLRIYEKLVLNLTRLDDSLQSATKAATKHNEEKKKQEQQKQAKLAAQERAKLQSSINDTKKLIGLLQLSKKQSDDYKQILQIKSSKNNELVEQLKQLERIIQSNVDGLVVKITNADQAITELVFKEPAVNFDFEVWQHNIDTLEKACETVQTCQSLVGLLHKIPKKYWNLTIKTKVQEQDAYLAKQKRAILDSIRNDAQVLKADIVTSYNEGMDITYSDKVELDPNNIDFVRIKKIAGAADLKKYIPTLSLIKKSLARAIATKTHLVKKHEDNPRQVLEEVGEVIQHIGDFDDTLKGYGIWFALHTYDKKQMPDVSRAHLTQLLSEFEKITAYQPKMHILLNQEDTMSWPDADEIQEQHDYFIRVTTNLLALSNQLIQKNNTAFNISEAIEIEMAKKDATSLFKHVAREIDIGKRFYSLTNFDENLACLKLIKKSCKQGNISLQAQDRKDLFIKGQKNFSLLREATPLIPDITKKLRWARDSVWLKNVDKDIKLKLIDAAAEQTIEHLPKITNNVQTALE